MLQWIEMFCEHAEKAKFAAAPSHYPVEQIQISTGKTVFVKDLNHFNELILDGLRGIEEALQKEFRNVSLKDVKIDWSVYDDLVKKMWGCHARCPFCKEPCYHSDEGHEKDEPQVPHKCMQHRPQGVGHYRWRGSGVLTIETCNYYVASDCEYTSPTGSGQYKQYHQNYPDWDIKPDSNLKESSSYWMWFMAKYVKELADEYEAKAPEIPNSWRQITVDQAKTSLKDSYCN